VDKYKLIQVILNHQYAIQQLRGLALFNGKPPMTTVEDYGNFLNRMISEIPTSEGLPVSKEAFECVITLHKMFINNGQNDMDSIINELKDYTHNLVNEELKEVLRVVKEIPKLEPVKEIKDNIALTFEEVKEQIQINRNNRRIK